MARAARPPLADLIQARSERLEQRTRILWALHAACVGEAVAEWTADVLPQLAASAPTPALTAAGDDGWVPDPEFLDSVPDPNFEAWAEAQAAYTDQVVIDAMSDHLTEHGVRLQAIDWSLPNPRAMGAVAVRQNQLVGVPTDWWQSTVRPELYAAVARGESIDQAAARLDGLIDPYYRNRARTVARTTIISATNAGQLEVAKQFGFGPRQWIATGDGRTRPTHALAGGQTVDPGEMFVVGGHELEYPGDPSGPPQEVINCRCTIIYPDIGFITDTDPGLTHQRRAMSTWAQADMLRRQLAEHLYDRFVKSWADLIGEPLPWMDIFNEAVKPRFRIFQNLDDLLSFKQRLIDGGLDPLDRDGPWGPLWEQYGDLVDVLRQAPSAGSGQIGQLLGLRGRVTDLAAEAQALVPEIRHLINVTRQAATGDVAHIGLAVSMAHDIIDVAKVVGPKASRLADDLIEFADDGVSLADDFAGLAHEFRMAVHNTRFDIGDTFTSIRTGTRDTIRRAGREFVDDIRALDETFVVDVMDAINPAGSELRQLVDIAGKLRRNESVSLTRWREALDIVHPGLGDRFGPWAKFLHEAHLFEVPGDADANWWMAWDYAADAAWGEIKHYGRFAYYFDKAARQDQIDIMTLRVAVEAAVGHGTEIALFDYALALHRAGWDPIRALDELALVIEQATDQVEVAAAARMAAIIQELYGDAANPITRTPELDERLRAWLVDELGTKVLKLDDPEKLGQGWDLMLYASENPDDLHGQGVRLFQLVNPELPDSALIRLAVDTMIEKRVNAGPLAEALDEVLEQLGTRAIRSDETAEALIRVLDNKALDKADAWALAKSLRTPEPPLWLTRASEVVQRHLDNRRAIAGAADLFDDIPLDAPDGLEAMADAVEAVARTLSADDIGETVQALRVLRSNLAAAADTAEQALDAAAAAARAQMLDDADTVWREAITQLRLVVDALDVDPLPGATSASRWADLAADHREAANAALRTWANAADQIDAAGDAAARTARAAAEGVAELAEAEWQATSLQLLQLYARVDQAAPGDGFPALPREVWQGALDALDALTSANPASSTREVDALAAYIRVNLDISDAATIPFRMKGRDRDTLLDLGDLIGDTFAAKPDALWPRLTGDLPELPDYLPVARRLVDDDAPLPAGMALLDDVTSAPFGQHLADPTGPPLPTGRLVPDRTPTTLAEALEDVADTTTVNGVTTIALDDDADLNRVAVALQQLGEHDPNAPLAAAAEWRAGLADSDLVALRRYASEGYAFEGINSVLRRGDVDDGALDVWQAINRAGVGDPDAIGDANLAEVMDMLTGWRKLTGGRDGPDIQIARVTLADPNRRAGLVRAVNTHGLTDLLDGVKWADADYDDATTVARRWLDTIGSATVIDEARQGAVSPFDMLPELRDTMRGRGFTDEAIERFHGLFAGPGPIREAARGDWPEDHWRDLERLVWQTVAEQVDNPARWASLLDDHFDAAARAAVLDEFLTPIADLYDPRYGSRSLEALRPALARINGPGPESQLIARYFADPDDPVVRDVFGRVADTIIHHADMVVDLGLDDVAPSAAELAYGRTAASAAARSMLGLLDDAPTLEGPTVLWRGLNGRRAFPDIDFDAADIDDILARDLRGAAITLDRGFMSTSTDAATALSFVETAGARTDDAVPTLFMLNIDEAVAPTIKALPGYGPEFEMILPPGVEGVVGDIVRVAGPDGPIMIVRVDVSAGFVRTVPDLADIADTTRAVADAALDRAATAAQARIAATVTATRAVLDDAADPALRLAADIDPPPPGAAREAADTLANALDAPDTTPPSLAGYSGQIRALSEALEAGDPDADAQIAALADDVIAMARRAQAGDTPELDGLPEAMEAAARRRAPNVFDSLTDLRGATLDTDTGIPGAYFLTHGPLDPDEKLPNPLERELGDAFRDMVSQAGVDTNIQPAHLWVRTLDEEDVGDELQAMALEAYRRESYRAMNAATRYHGGLDDIPEGPADFARSVSRYLDEGDEYDLDLIRAGLDDWLEQARTRIISDDVEPLSWQTDVADNIVETTDLLTDAISYLEGQPFDDQLRSLGGRDAIDWSGFITYVGDDIDYIRLDDYLDDSAVNVARLLADNGVDDLADLDWHTKARALLDGDLAALLEAFGDGDVDVARLAHDNGVWEWTDEVFNDLLDETLGTVEDWYRLQLDEPGAYTDAVLTSIYRDLEAGFRSMGFNPVVDDAQVALTWDRMLPSQRWHGEAAASLFRDLFAHAADNELDTFGDALRRARQATIKAGQAADDIDLEPSGTILFRGLDGALFFDTDDDNVLRLADKWRGRVVELDTTFMSTTSDPNIAIDFATKERQQLRTMFVLSIDMDTADGIIAVAGNAAESEHILPPGLAGTIGDMVWDTDLQMLIVRVDVGDPILDVADDLDDAARAAVVALTQDQLDDLDADRWIDAHYDTLVQAADDYAADLEAERYLAAHADDLIDAATQVRTIARAPVSTFDEIGLPLEPTLYRGVFQVPGDDPVDIGVGLARIADVHDMRIAGHLDTLPDALAASTARQPWDGLDAAARRAVFGRTPVVAAPAASKANVRIDQAMLDALYQRLADDGHPALFDPNDSAIRGYFGRYAEAIDEGRRRVVDGAEESWALTWDELFEDVLGDDPALGEQAVRYALERMSDYDTLRALAGTGDMTSGVFRTAEEVAQTLTDPTVRRYIAARTSRSKPRLWWSPHWMAPDDPPPSGAATFDDFVARYRDKLTADGVDLADPAAVNDWFYEGPQEIIGDALEWLASERPSTLLRRDISGNGLAGVLSEMDKAGDLGGRFVRTMVDAGVISTNHYASSMPERALRYVAGTPAKFIAEYLPDLSDEAAASATRWMLDQIDYAARYTPPAGSTWTPDWGDYALSADDWYISATQMVQSRLHHLTIDDVAARRAIDEAATEVNRFVAFGRADDLFDGIGTDIDSLALARGTVIDAAGRRRLLTTDPTSLLDGSTLDGDRRVVAMYVVGDDRVTTVSRVSDTDFVTGRAYMAGDGSIDHTYAAGTVGDVIDLPDLNVTVVRIDIGDPPIAQVSMNDDMLYDAIGAYYDEITADVEAAAEAFRREADDEIEQWINAFTDPVRHDAAWGNIREAIDSLDDAETRKQLDFAIDAVMEKVQVAARTIDPSDTADPLAEFLLPAGRAADRWQAAVDAARARVDELEAVREMRAKFGVVDRIDSTFGRIVHARKARAFTPAGPRVETSAGPPGVTLARLVTESGDPANVASLPAIMDDYLRLLVSDGDLPVAPNVLRDDFEQYLDDLLLNGAPPLPEAYEEAIAAYRSFTYRGINAVLRFDAVDSDAPAAAQLARWVAEYDTDYAGIRRVLSDEDIDTLMRFADRHLIVRDETGDALTEQTLRNFRQAIGYEPHSIVRTFLHQRRAVDGWEPEDAVRSVLAARGVDPDDIDDVVPWGRLLEHIVEENIDPNGVGRISALTTLRAVSESATADAVGKALRMAGPPPGGSVLGAKVEVEFGARVAARLADGFDALTREATNAILNDVIAELDAKPQDVAGLRSWANLLADIATGDLDLADAYHRAGQGLYDGPTATRIADLNRLLWKQWRMVADQIDPAASRRLIFDHLSWDGLLSLESDLVSVLGGTRYGNDALGDVIEEALGGYGPLSEAEWLRRFGAGDFVEDIRGLIEGDRRGDFGWPRPQAVLGITDRIADYMRAGATTGYRPEQMSPAEIFQSSVHAQNLLDLLADRDHRTTIGDLADWLEENGNRVTDADGVRTILWRGTDAHHALGVPLDGDYRDFARLVGTDHVLDEGMVSSTTNAGIAMGFATKTRQEGPRVVFMLHFDDDFARTMPVLRGNDNEHEFILPPGLTGRIGDILAFPDDGITVVRMDFGSPFRDVYTSPDEWLPYIDHFLPDVIDMARVTPPAGAADEAADLVQSLLTPDRFRNVDEALDALGLDTSPLQRYLADRVEAPIALDEITETTRALIRGRELARRDEAVRVLDELRADMRVAADAYAAELRAQLDADFPGMGTTVGVARTKGAPEDEWFYHLSFGERQNLIKKGFVQVGGAYKSDQLADIAGETANPDAVMERWLEDVRLIMEAETLSNTGRIAADKDVSWLGYVDENLADWPVNELVDRLGGGRKKVRDVPAIDAVVRHMRYSETEQAVTALAPAAEPEFGRPAWDLSFEQWRDELFAVLDDATGLTPDQNDVRYTELVPPTLFIDDSLIDWSDLESVYAEIIETAIRGGYILPR